jgi:NTP pyrophosphatase (non-canonical NTP hydrolase)
VVRTQASLILITTSGRSRLQQRTTLANLTKATLEFRDEREWAQFHTPKDMAISLCLEAAELLEFMQWKSGDELEKDLETRRTEVSHELADILYWTLLIAHHLQLDLAQALFEKLELNRKKYPVETARASSKKYTEI